MNTEKKENSNDALMSCDDVISKANLPYPNKPVGVGGFLKFFAIFVCVIFPLLGGVSLFDDVSSIELANPGISDLSWWENIKHVYASGWIVQLLIFFYICSVVYNGKKKSTKWKIIMLIWVAGPLAGIVSGFLIFIFAPSDFFSHAFAEIFSGVLGSAFWAMIWSLYFLFSKRVANTYAQ